jgi:uncharacterized SAM-binding protein YcdF (DUF218 family)
MYSYFENTTLTSSKMVSRIIHFFTPLGEPIGILWLLHVFWAVSLVKRKRWREALFPGLLAVLLWICGSTPISAHLVASLERSQAQMNRGAISNSDAVIMLGGCVHPSQYDSLGIELADSADRIMTAWNLIREDKGKALVLGGSGRSLPKGEQIDGQLLQDWFAYWGSISVPTYNLGICANTRQEAERAKVLAERYRWQRIILVTSAFHMNRAEATFRKVGIPVIPVACDFQVIGREEAPASFTFSPELEKIYLLGLYLHEKIGLLIYRLRGWA